MSQTSEKLSVRYAFGVNPNVKNNLAYCDENHVAYVSGNQVVVANTETREQHFIQSMGVINNPPLGITAITTSLSKKLLAVAEISDPVAIVTFYDSVSLKKKKTLIFPDLGSKEIKCMAFSEDGRNLIMQGAGPEWNLVLWNVEKTSKVIASVRTNTSEEFTVNQISFAPSDPSQLVITVFGKAILKMYRFVENQLRPGALSVRRDQANFLCHAWLDEDSLVVGTEGGEILYFENFDYRATIFPPNSMEGEEAHPVYSLAKTSRGGFVSGHSHGEVRMFDRREAMKDPYQLDDVYYIRGYADVVEIAAGLDESLVCATNTQQIMTFTPSSIHNAKEKAEEGCGFDHLIAPFHGPSPNGESNITGMSVALWRPILATTGLDHTLRVWNYSDHKLEYMHEFEDEPMAVGVHPNGIYVVVGFADRIRMMTMLLGEMHQKYEINARFCTAVKFSNGGQFFAAANQSNLVVFDTFTGAMICTLRGHPNKIRNLVWLDFDHSIMSVGSEGSVFFWDLFPPSRRTEGFLNPTAFTAGTCPSSGSKVFTTSVDRILKEIPFQRATNATGGLETTLKAPTEIEIGHAISQMHFDEFRQMLLLATGDPQQPSAIMTTHAYGSLVGSFESTYMHGAPITALVVSSDGNVVFSADKNGVICISEFETALAVKAGSKAKEGQANFEFNEEVVVHSAQLQNRKVQMAELAAQVDQLNLNSEHEMRLREMEHNNKVKEKKKQFATHLKAEQNKFEDQHNDKNRLIETYKDRMEELAEKQQAELSGLESKARTKLNTESNRYDTLVSEIDELHRRWNEENAALVESHQTYLAEITEEYEEKLQHVRDKQMKIQSDKDAMQVDASAKHEVIEDDAQIEIDAITLHYESRLKQEESAIAELKATNEQHKVKLDAVNKERDQHVEDIKVLRDKESRLLESIKQLEIDIQNIKKDIRQRDEHITEIEKRIFDLKKKNQELEKFRYVLDYKIKELKQQIEPREHEISSMRKQIEEMHLELEQYHKSSRALNLMIEELKLKIDGIRREITAQEDRIELDTQVMDKYRRDLQELWESKDRPNDLKTKIVELHRFYVQEDLITGADMTGPGGTSGPEGKGDGEDPQRLYNRDREQMERNLDSLRRALKTNSLCRKRDLSKMVRDSVVLTKELNMLRKDAKQLEIQKKAIDEANALGPAADLDELMVLLGVDAIGTGVARGIGATVQKAPSKYSRSATQIDLLPATEETQEEDMNLAPQPMQLQLMRKGVHRSSALRYGRAPATQTARNDQWEAWREIDMQAKLMSQLEKRLEAVCSAMNVDANDIYKKIDRQVLMMNTK